MSHKGALTGGYFDTRRSRLDLHKAHMQLVKEITEVEKQLAEHKQKLSDILYLRARNLVVLECFTFRFWHQAPFELWKCAVSILCGVGIMRVWLLHRAFFFASPHLSLAFKCVQNSDRCFLLRLVYFMCIYGPERLYYRYFGAQIYGQGEHGLKMLVVLP